MTPESLRALLANHAEDQFTERKSQGVRRSDIAKTACAFANSLPARRTAVLFIGVDDKTGKVTGVPNSDALQKTVHEACGGCYPPIRPVTTVLMDNGLEVLAVVFEHSTQQPHFIGPAYVRRGSESIQASAEQMKELVLNHVELARLLMPHKGFTVTLEMMGQNIELRRPLADPHEFDRRVCTLRDITTQYAEFEDSARGTLFTLPLTALQLRKNYRHLHPLLEVTGWK